MDNDYQPNRKSPSPSLSPRAASGSSSSMQIPTTVVDDKSFYENFLKTVVDILSKKLSAAMELLIKTNEKYIENKIVKLRAYNKQASPAQEKEKRNFIKTVLIPTIKKRLDENYSEIENLLKKLLQQHFDIIKKRLKYLWDDTHTVVHNRSIVFLNEHLSNQCIDIFEDFFLSAREMIFSFESASVSLIEMTTRLQTLPPQSPLSYHPIVSPSIVTDVQLRLFNKGQNKKKILQDYMKSKAEVVHANAINQINSFESLIKTFFNLPKEPMRLSELIDDVPSASSSDTKGKRRAHDSSPARDAQTKRAKFEDIMDIDSHDPMYSTDYSSDSEGSVISDASDTDEGSSSRASKPKPRSVMKVKTASSGAVQASKGKGKAVTRGKAEFDIALDYFSGIRKTIDRKMSDFLSSLTPEGSSPEMADIVFAQNKLNEFVRDINLYCMREFISLQHDYSNLS